MAFPARPLSLALVVFTAAAPASLAQRWFPTPRTFAGTGTAVAVGDVDLDNDDDVLFIDGGSYSIQRNDGAGDFTPDAPVGLPLGFSLQNDRPALEDVDGDGTLDFVISGAPGLFILRGTGTGAFLPALTVSLPAPGNQFATGDFNQDGVRDIVVASGSNPVTVRWVFWNAGQFQQTAPASVPSLLAASAIAAGDLDNDGDDDAVVSGAAAGTFETILTVAGVPTFGQSFPVGQLGSDTIYVAAGDLDGDGDDDVLTVIAKSDDVTLQPYLNQAGTIGPGASVKHTSGTLGITVGADGMELVDWDQDGDLDLASQISVSFLNLGNLSALFFQNVGGATYAFPAAIPVPKIGRMGGVGDFDGDGHTDFCGAGSIIFGDGTFDAPFPIQVGLHPAGASVVDLEGDGDLDLVNGSIQYRNDATGTFVIEAGLLPDPGPNFYYQGPVAHGDFTGDGRLDFLVELWIPVGDIFVPDVFVECRVVAGTPSGVFVDLGFAAANPGLHIGGTGTRSADFDGDGDIDVFTPGGLYLNDGTPFFTIVQSVGFSTVEDAADVDGDGDIDVLVSSGNELYLLRREVGFYSVVLALSQPGLLPTARLLDVDGDLDLDVVAPSNQINVKRIQVATLLPNGTFAPPISLDPVGVSAEIFAVDDLDGDGLGDLVAVSQKFDGAHWSLAPYGTIVAFRRTGAGLTYEPARRWLGRESGALFDVDADGDLDVVGRTIVRGARFSSPAQGRIRQYGLGTPGTGGAVPVLGAQGPATSSSTSFELRVRDAVGGATSVMLLGVSETSIVGFPFAGMELLIGGTPILATVKLGGTAGAAGEGTLTIPVLLPPAFAGQTVHLQMWHVDTGAPNWLNQSNGLELTFGT